jgi:hypothetical protein
MATKTVAPRDWLEFEHWASEELNLFEFQLKLMTDAEKADQLGKRNSPEPRLVVNDKGELSLDGAADASEPELNDQEWKQMLDEMDAWDKEEKAELLAFAEKFGCNIYLAAYLRHLNFKLDMVADALASGKTAAQEFPKRRKRRK